LKLAVGLVPGGSGVLALDSLSKGEYAEAALEVFFLVPWLRLAGGGLNHIKIVARNGDEVIVSRQAVEAWQQVVYNGGKAGLKRAEDLGQALKAGGRSWRGSDNAGNPHLQFRRAFLGDAQHV
jgi:hypothetical protein